MNDLVDMEWKSFTVYREFPVENDEKKGFIDIFCISEEKKCIICFENEIAVPNFQTSCSAMQILLKKSIAKKAIRRSLCI